MLYSAQRIYQIAEKEREIAERSSSLAHWQGASTPYRHDQLRIFEARRLGLGLGSGLLGLRYRACGPGRGPGREPGSPLGEIVDA